MSGMSVVLRAIAVAIAVAAFLDPSMPIERQAPLVVGVRVAATPPTDDVEAVVERLHQRAAGRATLARVPAWSRGGWCSGLDACLVVTDGTTAIEDPPDAILHVVDAGSPTVPRVVAARASAGHVVEQSTVAVAIAGGRPGEVVPVVVAHGDVEVARLAHERTASRIDEVVVPWSPRRQGGDDLTVSIDGSDGAPGLVHRVAVDVTDTTMDVLVWEARPSWSGTFVRRALQADSRLAVRAVSEVAPRRLVGQGLDRRPSDADLRRAQAVVVAGTPALDGSSVARLERYVRDGGSLAILLDDAPTGPVTRLLPDVRGNVRRSLEPATVAPALRAGELLAFTRAVGDVALASVDGDAGAEVIVERGLGRGRLVVSGTLDAWRWRDEAGGFDRFWTDTVVRLARVAGPPLMVRPAPTPSGVGRRLIVSRRGPRDDAAWPAIEHALSCSGGEGGTVLATPLPASGDWALDVGGASSCGLTVSMDGASTTAPWPGAIQTPVAAPDPAALTRMAVLSGGRVVEGAGAEALIDAVIDQAQRRVPVRWHPMRAWWWVLAFVAALGGEWWLRRRAGRA